MRKLNKPLLRRLARKLRRLRHEEHYAQEVTAVKTSCGTAACIAGHTVDELKYRLVFEPRLQHDRGDLALDECLHPMTGKPVSVIEAARKELGLSQDAACALFSAYPTESWPEVYASRLARRDDTKERPSRIAADLLDAIADTNGKILA